MGNKGSTGQGHLREKHSVFRNISSINRQQDLIISHKPQTSRTPIEPTQFRRQNLAHPRPPHRLPHPHLMIPLQLSHTSLHILL